MECGSCAVVIYKQQRSYTNIKMGKKLTVSGKKNKKAKGKTASEEDHRVQILQIALAEAID